MRLKVGIQLQRKDFPNLVQIPSAVPTHLDYCTHLECTHLVLVPVQDKGVFLVNFILHGAPPKALSWEELMLKLLLLLKVVEAFCSRPEIRENQQ